MDVRNLPSGPGDFIRPDNAHRATFNVFICFNEEDGKDRSSQTLGVVTDVGLFLHRLAEALRG